MAEIASQQPGAAGLAMDSTDAMGTELYSRRSSIRAPEPNPNFSFPRLPQNPDHLSTLEPSRNRRIRPQNLAILPPPPPAEAPSGTPGTLEPSMDTSPGKSRPMSARSGHRRGGSEFIGGDGSKAGPGLMSTSPTKGADVLPSPAASAGRRRGHAHRRSGAMSTNDFSAFLNSSAAAAPPLPGSAPSTPPAEAHDIPPIPHLERAQSQPSMTAREKINVANAAAAIEDKELASTPKSTISRPRVGFSERLEFIPRPLSTISSETASSMSTVRPSHSTSGSINSILDQRPPTPVSGTYPADDDSRPTTSDSFQQQPFFGPLETSDFPSSPRRPPSASGKALFEKRRASSPPPKTHEGDNVSPGALDPYHSVPPSSNQDLLPIPMSPSSVATVDSGNEPKDVRRQSRVRSFADRLTRKSRPKSKEEMQESSTPAVPDDPNVPAGMLSLEDVDFDDDTSLVIHSAGYEETKPAPFQPSPSPIKESFDKDDSAAFDLDATWDAVKIDEDSPNSLTNIMRASARQHRRTESAPSLSPVQRHSFAHNKLSMSPQMDVFAEEDEEEDSPPPRSQRPKAWSFAQPKREDLQGLGVQIVDAEAGESIPPRRKSRSPSSKAESSISDGGASVPEVPTQGTATSGTRRDLSVKTANVVEEPHFSTITKSSDEETVTPTGIDVHSPTSTSAPALPLTNGTLPQPLELIPPPSLAPHAHNDSLDFSSASSAPSPNPTTTSFDNPRLNTAASSITDRTNWSATQPTSACADSSRSVEDVPSLTSSASTTLNRRPSFPPQQQAPPRSSPLATPGQGYHAHTFSGTPSAFIAGNARPQTTDGDHAFSFVGIAPRPSRPRNWGAGSRPSTAGGSKRASLASLSRLMSKGGESERSKLSISWGAADALGQEQREGAEGGIVVERKKESKGKRLSRVLKFWKSKERLNEPASVPE